jgi:hypothetical protein
MSPTTERVPPDPEPFLRFGRRRSAALLGMAVGVGAVGLALVLTPSGPAWGVVSRAALLPVGVVLALVAWLSIRGRRWAPGSPEVVISERDEWQRTNRDRAARAALVVVLVAQYPLAWLFGLLLPGLQQPRPAFAMAFATVTLALATELGLFLHLDRA